MEQVFKNEKMEKYSSAGIYKTRQTQKKKITTS